MGVVHHSNYIRWFEEARVDLLEQVGLDYAQMEQRGCMSPVLAVQCRYRSPARFGEQVRIEAAFVEVGRVRFRVRYTVTDAATGQLRATGETEHCFTDRQGRPIALGRHDPELFARLQALVVPEAPDKA